MTRSGSRCISMVCVIEASYIPDAPVLSHSFWDITITFKHATIVSPCKRDMTSLSDENRHEN